MTQLFDPETGQVTPVTVIEAGPCPIVRVKTVDSDGYEAVQLAFEPVAERKVTKPRLGQLGAAGAHRKLVEFRGTTELTPPPPRDGGPGPGNLVIPIRRWEEFLSLGVTEIRLYGASGIQVTRRLRAMLEELHDDVRPEHRAAVDDELDRLTATVSRSFRDSPDLDRALTPDPEGLGGLPSDGGE